MLAKLGAKEEALIEESFTKSITRYIDSNYKLVIYCDPFVNLTKGDVFQWDCFGLKASGTYENRHNAGVETDPKLEPL